MDTTLTLIPFHQYRSLAGSGIAVATGVVAARVVGLNAEGSGSDSEASKVVANLVTRAVVASVASAGQSGSKSEESGVDLHVVGWLICCLIS